MAESRPRLGYWHIRGLAAQIRYMLHYAKVDFEDVTYDVSAAPEWSRASWTDVKFTLGLDFPNLPYFFDGELNLTETAAIMKYIAHKWAPELLGKDLCSVRSRRDDAGALRPGQARHHHASLHGW